MFDAQHVCISCSTKTTLCTYGQILRFNSQFKIISRTVPAKIGR